MPLLRKLLGPKSNNSPRVEYHWAMPKWQLDVNTFTQEDVNWLRDLIHESTSSQQLQEYLSSKCGAADLSAANAYLRKFAGSLGKGKAGGSMAQYQARKKLLQEIQTERSDKVFKRPGKQMFKWTSSDREAIEAGHFEEPLANQIIIRRIASQWGNPLKLEKPAEAKRLIRDVAKVLWLLPTFSGVEAEELDPSIWLVNIYAALAMRVQEAWWCVIAKVAHTMEPADTGASLAAILDSRSAAPSEAPHTDVPELGHRHKRPPEGSDQNKTPHRVGEKIDVTSILAILPPLSTIDPTQSNIICAIGYNYPSPMPAMC